jgi:hypothetical protein
MATRRKRFSRWGKAGALAKYVHRAADLHAVKNPDIRKAAPRTERDLARAMKAQAAEALAALNDAVARNVRRGSWEKLPNIEDARVEMREIVREYEEVLRRTAAEATRAAYGGGKAAMLAQLADVVDGDLLGLLGRGGLRLLLGHRLGHRQLKHG